MEEQKNRREGHQSEMPGDFNPPPSEVDKPDFTRAEELMLAQPLNPFVPMQIKPLVESR